MLNNCLSLFPGIQIAESSKINIAPLDNWIPPSPCHKKVMQGTWLQKRQWMCKQDSCKLKESQSPLPHAGCDISTRPLAQASDKSVRLASTIFVAKKLFKLQNEHCVLHSILLRKSLSKNWLFLFYKVLYSELSNKLVSKGNIGLRK